MGFIGIFLLLIVVLIIIFGVAVLGFGLLVAGIIILIIKCSDKTDDPIRINRNNKFKIAGTIMTIVGVLFVIPASFLTIFVGVKLTTPVDVYVECEVINCEYDKDTYTYSFSNDNISLVSTTKYVYDGTYDDLTPKYSIKENNFFKSSWYNLYSYEYNGFTLYVARGENLDYTLYIEESKLDDFCKEYHEDCLWTVRGVYSTELSNIISKYYLCDNISASSSFDYDDIYYCYSRSSNNLIAGDMVYILEKDDKFYFSTYFNPKDTRYIEISSEDAEIIKKIPKL